LSWVDDDVEPARRRATARQPHVGGLGGHARHALLIKEHAHRALDDAGNTTGCAPGVAKTVWVAGTLTQFGANSVGLVVPVAGEHHLALVPLVVEVVPVVEWCGLLHLR
jgi:hypothetical protein